MYFATYFVSFLDKGKAPFLKHLGFKKGATQDLLQLITYEKDA